MAKRNAAPAAAESAAAAASPPAGGEKPKKRTKGASRPPIELAERALRKQIALLPDGEQALKDGVNGIVRLLQTVEEVVGRDPAAGTAWAAVVQVGRSRRQMAELFASKPKPEQAPAAPAAPAPAAAAAQPQTSAPPAPVAAQEPAAAAGSMF